MSTKPVQTPSMANEAAIAKWRNSGGIDREDIFILVMSVIVLLVLILVAISSLEASPLAGVARASATVRVGPERKLAWLARELKLTGEQQATAQPIPGNQHRLRARCAPHGFGDALD